jgi:hypothetical protein
MRCRDCHRRGGFIIFLFFCLFSVPGLLSGCGGSDLKFPTEYQAVFLDNGQAFFGKLEDAGSPFLMLRDVFYVQQKADPQKKEVKNLLVKRGGEWHTPDFMRINARHVVLIEPVSPDSRVAQLIKEAQAVKSSETNEVK